MADSYTFDNQSVHRIARAVRQVERMRSNLAPLRANRRNVYSSASPLIPVRLTAYVNASGAKNYSAVRREPNNAGGYSDVSPAVAFTGTVFEKSGFVGRELGGTVLIQSAGTWLDSSLVLPSGTPIYTFVFVEPRALFAVKVTKQAGAAGPPSTWTYSVTSPDGHVIVASGSPVSPELRRPTGTATTNPTAGTIGTGYYDAAGVFHLFDANESC